LFLPKVLLFAFRGSAVRCQEKQTPFLEVPRRLAVRAVKGAVFAFTGAKRKPFTEEADGLGAGFGRKGGNVWLVDGVSEKEIETTRCGRQVLPTRHLKNRDRKNR